jgi:hypothetical protein
VNGERRNVERCVRHRTDPEGPVDHAVTGNPPRRLLRVGYSIPSRASAPGAISRSPRTKETLMNRIVYIVGAVVIIIALLSFFGLR